VKLIILEGPDGAGKTTLARELEKCGYVYVHHGVPPASETDLFRWFLKPLIHLSHMSAVFDRLHLSDRIYGPIMRGGSPMTELQEQLIERYLYARGGQVIICLPPWRTVLNNWLKNQENEYVDTPAKLFEIYNGYHRLLRIGRPYARFDHTRQDVGSYAKALADMHNFVLPDTYVGSPSARFLLVGERANGEPDLPFMDWKNSSGYLHDCLADAGYVEEEIAFVNAYSLHGEQMSFSDKDKRTFIALGNVAHKSLRDQNVQCALVAHPSYWKRFHMSERDKYIELLSKVRRSAP
jgi:hypothetical protein